MSFRGSNEKNVDADREGDEDLEHLIDINPWMQTQDYRLVTHPFIIPHAEKVSRLAAQHSSSTEGCRCGCFRVHSKLDFHVYCYVT